MRHVLAAGAVGLGLCWEAPAFASDEVTCPVAPVEFGKFEPVGEEALKERAAIMRLMTAIEARYIEPLYPAMNSAQFAEAAATAKLIHSEYLTAQGEWLAARNSGTADIAACKKLTEEIATLRKTSASMSPGGDITALDAVIKVKGEKLKEVVEETKKKVEKAQTAYKTFEPRRDFLVAFAHRFPKPEAIAQHLGRRAPQSAQVPNRDGQACLIDDAAQRRDLDPNKCTFLSQDTAAFIKPPSFSSTISEVPIAGQPVDKRGITVSITGSKDSSDLSLSLTDTFRSRWPWTPGDNFQRLTSWGYKVGVSTGGKNGNLLDFNERDEKDRLTNQLDRLDAKTKLSLSLFYADYGIERVTEFDARSAKFHKAAHDACISAQGKPDAFPSTCEGEQLMAWIFAQKDGAYLHGAHATAFGSLYFAPPPTKKYAKRGGGINVDIALPSYAFKDLPAGAAPAELLAAELINDRKLTFTIAPYAFFRMPGSGERFGWTLIPSVTLKREYDTEDAVTVCPPTTPGQPFSLSCGDPFLPERPERKTYLVPSLETRFIWSGTRLGRFHFPQFGLAPKASYDTEAERWEVTVPAYFAVDSSKSLTAGLSLIHRTGGTNDAGEERKDETGVAIIVGKTFSLDPSF
jgi:hypothetical protein